MIARPRPFTNAQQEPECGPGSPPARNTPSRHPIRPETNGCGCTGTPRRIAARGLIAVFTPPWMSGAALPRPVRIWRCPTRWVGLSGPAGDTLFWHRSTPEERRRASGGASRGCPGACSTPHRRRIACQHAAPLQPDRATRRVELSVLVTVLRPPGIPPPPPIPVPPTTPPRPPRPHSTRPPSRAPLATLPAPVAPEELSVCRPNRSKLAMSSKATGSWGSSDAAPPR